MSVNTPPAGAKHLKVYGYEIALFIESIFDSEDGVRVVYKKDGAWHFLTMPSYYMSDINTKEKAMATWKNVLDKINKEIQEKLNPNQNPSEPESGGELMAYLLSKLFVVDDKIV